MPPPTPARAGFDAVLRRPALVLAEIAWRWCFGLASLALLGLTCLLYFDTIHVTDAEMQLARSGSPWLLADVLARVIQANAAPLLRGLAVLVPGIAVLWTIAAAVGRLITTPPLVREGHDFSRADMLAKTAPASAAEGRSAATSFRSLLAISFLRAAITLALIAGYFGCALLAGAFSNIAGGDPEARIQAFLLVFLPLFLLLLLAWALLNWLFSIAPVFAVRDGRAALASFADVLRLFSANRRDFVAIAAAYGLAKSIAIVVVTVIGVVLLSALNSLPWLLGIALVALTLAYFAFADLLNLARLAAYAVLAQVPAPASAGQVASA